MPDIGDVIELIADIPGNNLRSGLQGTIVHSHNDDAYEVEFANEKGETRDCLALRQQQFIIVWQAKTRQRVPIAEQASALLSNLPDKAAEEVLDFARFLSVRSHQSVGDTTHQSKE